MSKRVIFYHDDLDGISSAAVVIWSTEEEETILIPMKKFNQSGIIELDKLNIKDVKSVYVLDYTLSDMESVFELTNEFIWIDHHKSQSSHPLWSNVETKGIRRIGKAACELTWNYIRGEDIPLALKMIADRDEWRKEYKDSDDFITGMYSMKSKLDPCNIFWHNIICLHEFEGDRNDILSPIILDGRVINCVKMDIVRYWMKSGVKTHFMSHSCYCINTPFFHSEFGAEIYLWIDSDIILLWSMRGNFISVSLRSNKIDVSEIAKSYGGGGHAAASGFTLRNEREVSDFLNIIVTGQHIVA